MKLSEIDRVVQLRLIDFGGIIQLLNMKTAIDKERIWTIKDIFTAYRKTQSLLKDYQFNMDDIIKEAYTEEVEKENADETLLDNIKNVYSKKINDVINENISLLLELNNRNCKMIQIRNVNNMNQTRIVYDHSQVLDGAQRRISLVDKFRKDLRKVLIDYVNDMVIFSAYKNGKSFAYTKRLDGSLHTRFSISDYINKDVKKNVFHPNVQSLAYIED